MLRRKSFIIKPETPELVAVQSPLYAVEEIAIDEEAINAKLLLIAKKSQQKLDKIKQIMTEAEFEKDLATAMEISEGNLFDIRRLTANKTRCRTMAISAKNMDNTDLSKISKIHNSLFNLDISRNSISDLSSISNLKYLVNLNAANNQILAEGLDFNGISNLQDIDLSNNKISLIESLKHQQYIKNLMLDGNMISSLQVLSGCRYLKDLSMRGNKITSLEPLRGLPLISLDVSDNRDLESLLGVEDLKILNSLICKNCIITSLEPLEAHQTLTHLDLESNCLVEVDTELAILSTLPLLKSLVLLNNPMGSLSDSEWRYKGYFPLHDNTTFKPSFRLYTLYKVSQIISLDCKETTVEEKVAALNTYQPDVRVSLSVQHMNILKLKAKNYAVVQGEDLLLAKRLTPVVICGPTGVGKRTLTHHLLQEYPHIYGKCISHTTRLPREGEEEGVHYYFITSEEMNRMNTECKFIEFVNILGFQYGTSLESIENVTAQGKVCVLDLDYEGIIALKKSKLQPRYILIKCPSLMMLKERLTKSLKDTSTVDQWIERAKTGLYQDYQYDLVLMNDDFEKCYKDLRDFVIGNYWKDFEEDDACPHNITNEQIFFTSALSLGLINLKPIVTGHLLVISRRVVPRFGSLTAEEASDIFKSAHSISKVLEKVYGSEAITITLQDGVEAGQSVPHVHIHLIPRFKDWMNNDDIYKDIQASEKLMSERLQVPLKIPRNAARVDNEGREPRTSEDMRKEAEMLRPMFDQHEDIWE